MTTWQVQGAKQRFSEVIRGVEAGEPQFITKHGQPVAVVISIDDYRRTHGSRLGLTDFLLAGSEYVAVEIDLPPRVRDHTRSEEVFDLR